MMRSVRVRDGSRSFKSIKRILAVSENLSSGDWPDLRAGVEL